MSWLAGKAFPAAALFGLLHVLQPRQELLRAVFCTLLALVSDQSGGNFGELMGRF